MHRVVELIQSGAIGTVSEVHSWVGGERGMPEIPTDHPAPPASLGLRPMVGSGRWPTLPSHHLSLWLAILVGFWNRRNRQLGMPYPGHSLLGTWVAIPQPCGCYRTGGGCRAFTKVDALHHAIPHLQSRSCSGTALEPRRSGNGDKARTASQGEQHPIHWRQGAVAVRVWQASTSSRRAIL